MNLRSATAGLTLNLALGVFLAVALLSYLRGVEPLFVVLRGVGGFLAVIFFQRFISVLLEAWLGGETAPKTAPAAEEQKKTPLKGR
jgi:hypothetical protein